jgi:DNA replication and repair protein RecF
VRLRQLQIKNFRCFENKTVQFPDTITLVDGLNGSGKTSILEALHYLCYLRSFRTHATQDLIRFGQDAFFLKATLLVDTGSGEQETELQVGFSGKKRSVKINQKAIQSYQELMDYYRVVTLTEDDLLLIQGSPEERRTFLDLLLIMHEPQFADAARTLRAVVQNRNKLLQMGSVDKTMYTILTEQLWHASVVIRTFRREILTLLQHETNYIVATYFQEPVEIFFEYQVKNGKKYETLEQLLAANPSLYYDEIRYRRSLFGAQLDDFTVTFHDKRSRSFASRGQQKLIVLLLKIAQMRLLAAKKGPAIFLLDDFMTDFDEKRAQILLTVLSQLGNQVIVTSPLTGGILHDQLLQIGSHVSLASAPG